MNETKTADNTETDDTAEPARVSDRKAKREARRTTERSGLKRKISEADADTDSEEKPKPAPRAKAKRKPAKKKATALTTARKKPAARKTTAAPEDEYELRNQPDGTLLRVKVSKKKKVVPRRRQRDSGDSGPGPAIVDTSSMEVGALGLKKDGVFGPRTEKIRRSIDYLRRRVARKPKVAIILGSGLSPTAELVDGKKVEFSEIPEFSPLMVDGHPGQLITGSHDGIPLLFSAGRSHYYETGSMSETTHAIQAILALGIEHLIITTSAGALNPDYRKGDIMLVEDQINLMGDNPFFGVSPNCSPPVFVNCDSIYNDSLTAKYSRLCRSVRVRPQRGVLAAVRGPVYETPAEKHFIHSTGADAVCMSMIPEALVAARMGVSVTGLAIISNEASPPEEKPMSHDEVILAGKRNSERLKRLLAKLIPMVT